MTAVIGILNKRGVAIAADSAVTRVRRNEKKCTKNGNKMIRLSNAVPISVMITGNADFMSIPWDVIARRYRQERGNIKHSGVECCANDFFNYMSDNNVFWDFSTSSNWIEYIIDDLFQFVEGKIPEELSMRNDDGFFSSPKTYKENFVKECEKLRKNWLKDGICQQFSNYTIEQFSDSSKETFDHYLDNKDIMNDCNKGYPKEMLDDLRPVIELTVMTRLITRNECDRCAQLIFTGYGEKQDYPSLIPVVVCEGFDHKVSYHYRKEDVIEICDEKPVAICPFAQRDVVVSILRGVNGCWINSAIRYVNKKYNKLYDDIVYDEKYDAQAHREISRLIADLSNEESSKQFKKSFNKMLDKNQKVWEEALENYDLRAMAELAESLIDLTGFQRILTFQQEGVGGPVDVAVISKNDGFTWINRKSWYHHKDVNGQYGRLGV